MKYKQQENNHHLIAKSLHSEYRIDMPENIYRMSIVKHAALHSLFGMLLTPKEQLIQLREMYSTILGDTAKELFDELLDLDDYDFYIKGVKRGQKKKGYEINENS